MKKIKYSSFPSVLISSNCIGADSFSNNALFKPIERNFLVTQKETKKKKRKPERSRGEKENLNQALPIWMIHLGRSSDQFWSLKPPESIYISLFEFRVRPRGFGKRRAHTAVAANVCCSFSDSLLCGG